MSFDEWLNITPELYLKFTACCGALMYVIFSYMFDFLLKFIKLLVNKYRNDGGN